MWDISNEYDIEIESEYYFNDYDEVGIKQSEINNTESDILFE